MLQVKVIRDRIGRSITLSQELYIKDLAKRFGSHLEGLTRKFDSPYDANLELTVDQCPEVDTPEYAEMYKYRDVYMSLVGAYLWLANVTRPELCYISAQLARFVSNPGKAHYRAALRVLMHLDNSSSKGSCLKPNPQLKLRAFVDASWTSQFSVSGGLIDYVHGDTSALAVQDSKVSFDVDHRSRIFCCKFDGERSDLFSRVA